jgi:hypothetical protein
LWFQVTFWLRRQQFFHHPNMVSQARLHRRSDAQALVNPSERNKIAMDAKPLAFRRKA